jgi:hypothetical protein
MIKFGEKQTTIFLQKDYKINIKILLQEQNYKALINVLLDNYSKLQNKDITKLKKLLLFQAIDFVKNNTKDNIFQDKETVLKVRMLFDMNQDIFFYIYNHINDEEYILKKLKKHKYYNDIKIKYNNTKHNKFSKRILKSGLEIKQNYFQKKEIDKLKNITLELLNKFEKKKNIQSGFLNHSSYMQCFCEGKERIMFRNTLDAPEIFYKLMNNNKITKIIHNIVQTDVTCFSIQLERISKPKFYCDYTHWHLDKLTDQYKIMIPLNDIGKNDAPFTFIPNSHDCTKMPKELLNHYHHIYKVSGNFVLPSNGISQNIILKNNLKPTLGLANARDVIVFNTAIAHTASQVQNTGERLNLILVYHQLKTNRNQFFKIFDSFYNF